MKHCSYTHWLSICSHGNDEILLVSDRLQNLTDAISNPDTEKPTLFVLFGNTIKSATLRETFGVKRRRNSKQGFGEIHLNIDSSTVLLDRPIYLANGDFPIRKFKSAATAIDRSHGTRKRALQKAYGTGFDLCSADTLNTIYTHLLFPFVDIFCFFADDIRGLSHTAHYLATWLEKGHSSTLPQSTHPKIVILTKAFPGESASEIKARQVFLEILGDLTTKDPFEQFSGFDVVGLLPNAAMSIALRHRHLKERLIKVSDRVRIIRKETRFLFSATHFTVFFNYACNHISTSIDKPFSFIKASRIQSPVATDLDEHVSNF